MATTAFLAPIFTAAQSHPVALALLLLSAYLLSNRYQRRLDRIPGPWIRSVSTIPRMLSVYRGASHEDDLALHRRYGSIVRVAPNILSVSDPREISHIYGTGTKFAKSRFFELSSVYDEEGLVPDTFVLTDKKMHSRMKRNAANAYSLNGLLRMEPTLTAPTERLLDILDEAAASGGESVDLGELLKRYAMDAVFSLTFGKDLDFLRKGDGTGMTRTLDIFTDYMAIFGQVPWTHRLLLGNATVAAWFLGSASSSQDAMVNLAAEQVEQHRSASPSTRPEKEQGQAPQTFLARLLLNQRANPPSLTDREIATHAFGNIAAGSDTTATALRAVFTHLLREPRAYAKLRDELDGADLLGNDDDDGVVVVVSFARATALPYLAAVVREAVRLHPSVGMLLGRTVPPPGGRGAVVICGYEVRAGTEVGVNPWVVQRDPNGAGAFGATAEEAEAFVPERWIDAVDRDGKGERRKRMERCFFAFGAGAHTCSGRWIAMMEITKVVPTLLLRYDFEMVRRGEKGEDGVGFVNRWFTTQRGLEVRVKRRAVG